MTRHFELMEQIENAIPANPIHVDTAAGGADTANYVEGGEGASEEALSLIQQVFLLQTQEPPRMVVFAGVDHVDHSIRVAHSVADALARNACGPVCLVEANLRGASTSGPLATPHRLGLTDALLGLAPIRSLIEPTGTEDLWLLSSGRVLRDSPKLLTAERLKPRLAELRKEFSFVIIDAPPLARYPDAIGIGQHSDGIVMVLEAGSTRREAAQTVLFSVQSAKISILGAVLNNREYPIPEILYRRL